MLFDFWVGTLCKWTGPVLGGLVSTATGVDQLSAASSAYVRSTFKTLSPGQLTCRFIQTHKITCFRNGHVNLLSEWHDLSKTDKTPGWMACPYRSTCYSTRSRVTAAVFKSLRIIYILIGQDWRTSEVQPQSKIQSEIRAEACISGNVPYLHLHQNSSNQATTIRHPSDTTPLENNDCPVWFWPRMGHRGYVSLFKKTHLKEWSLKSA